MFSEYYLFLKQLDKGVWENFLKKQGVNHEEKEISWYLYVVYGCSRGVGRM
jgi:hypothetical protein